MNIVQLQYKLRDLPLSAVQAAANGRDPDIPEMLATMELNRRERMEKASAKPPTKSIKEQLEEKLSGQPPEQMGLPAMLQQAQQATGEPQQDQVQQPGQMPQMPAQMAQGQPQGQPGQPQQLRMGGVAGLPTQRMFKQFYNGGIVAFADGDLVEGENQSAAEVARLKQAEKLAQAQELMAALGIGQTERPVARQAPAPAMPADVQRANATIMQAPFVQQAGKSIEDMLAGTEVTTPEQEMEKRRALLQQYGVRRPGEDELARIAKSKEAYAEDVAKREGLQGGKILAAAARPNVYGRYMPGTMGEAATTFGLANLEIDRTFREANDKAEVAAKEAQRAFDLNEINLASKLSEESKAYKREANKAAATAYGQMAAHGLSALTQQLSTEEQKRYHDMWEKIEDRKIKAQIARDGQDRIPEVMKNIEYIKKNFPNLAQSMSPEQLIAYSAQVSAESRGAGSREDIANAQLIEKRAEKVQEAAKTDPGVLAAKTALAKAQKNKSAIEEEEAAAQLRRAMAAIEARFPMPAIGGRGGISTLPQPGANPPSSGSTIKYDAKGNRIP